MESITLAIIGHMVGDYILQTDWMAREKKKSTTVAAIHCLIWSACVVVFAGWSWISFAVLFVFHFTQDRTNIVRQWMKLIGQDGFATGPYAPWSVVVVDNTFHLVQIWLVWKFIA